MCQNCVIVCVKNIKSYDITVITLRLNRATCKKIRNPGEILQDDAKITKIVENTITFLKIYSLTCNGVSTLEG